MTFRPLGLEFTDYCQRSCDRKSSVCELFADCNRSYVNKLMRRIGAAEMILLGNSGKTYPFMKRDEAAVLRDKTNEVLFICRRSGDSSLTIQPYFLI